MNDASESRNHRVSSEPRELELKFLVAQPLPNHALLREAFERAGLWLSPTGTSFHRDRYFDDARLSLSRAGLALRRRVSDAGAVATLKTRGSVVGALHDRGELEAPVEGQEWPARILARIAQVTAPGLLQPHTMLEVERTLLEVSEGNDLIALIAYDIVTGRSQRGTGKVTFRELEIEAAASGAEQELARVAMVLQSLLTLRPSERTKLERVREMLMNPPDEQ